MKKIYFLLMSALALFAAVSCGGSAERMTEGGDTLTARSALLTLVDHGTYVTAEIADPWNDGKLLAAYALVGRDSVVPENIETGYTVVRVPLSRSIVYSSTNTGVLGELDALEAVAAVADGNYYSPSDTVSRLIGEGRIRDIGNSMSPDPEAIVEVSPDAVIVSPYENAGHGVLDLMGVPVIDFADYMETTPLGRAEWVLFLGELYGRRDNARELYTRVCGDYEALRDKVAEAELPKPKVLTETLTSGIWYVPGGRSYMARMLSDAGADYPWSDDSSTGSLQLDIASVIDRAADADIWISRTYGALRGREALCDITPLSRQFKAYETGRLYNCDTSVSPIFNDIAFHPERVLRDFIMIFHPGLIDDGEGMRYYKQIGQ